MLQKYNATSRVFQPRTGYLQITQIGKLLLYAQVIIITYAHNMILTYRVSYIYSYQYLSVLRIRKIHRKKLMHRFLNC